jgi:hypothetical protein
LAKQQESNQQGAGNQKILQPEMGREFTEAADTSQKTKQAEK